MAKPLESIDTEALHEGMFAEKYQFLLQNGIKDPVEAWYYATNPWKNPVNAIEVAREQAIRDAIPWFLRE